ncbi:MAG: hypothetical protein ACQKBY_11095 [Verrucomicrobiales bacterium]
MNGELSAVAIKLLAFDRSLWLFTLRLMKRTTFLAVLGSFCYASVSQAAILVSDNFDNVASGAGINGRSEDGVNFINEVNDNSWVTNTTQIRGDGAGGLLANPQYARNILLDMGAGYFVSNPGVYQISMDVTTPVGGTGDSWFGIGFTSAQVDNEALNVLGASPWLLYRNTGDVIAFAGPGANYSYTTTASQGATHNFVIQLDTSGSQWLATAFIDGAQLDMNIGNTSSEEFPYGTNPESIRYIGFSTGLNGD